MDQALQDVVTEVSALIGAPATLEDRAFRLIAFGSQTAEIDAVREASILRRGSSPEVRTWFEQFGIATAAGPVRVPAHPELGVRARLCLPARWRGVTYGYLWLLDDGRVADERALAAAGAVAERAGALLARATRARAAVEAHVLELVGDDRDDAEAAAAALAEANLLDPADAHAVVAAPGATPPSEPRRGVLAAGVPDGCVLVVPASYGTAALASLAGGGPAGVGDPRTHPWQLRDSWAEARVAARVARDVAGTGPLASWASLGAYRLLSVGSRPALARAVLDPAVRSLLDCGDGRLVETARCWLGLAGSAAATSAALHVHRQTLYARLHRVEAVTGLDLSRGEDRLRLHLGLLLAPLLR